MPTSAEDVAKLYGSIAGFEETRLATHPMEREITLRTIRHWLGASPAPSEAFTRRVADIGGGPGKLAFALADEGHHVDLVDLSPDLIRLARDEQSRRESAQSSRRLASISVGNALDLESLSLLQKGSYDVVLLLGPLYHLVEEAERKTAVENACRLAKPATGLIFCAFVSIEAHLRDLAMREPARLVREKGFYDRYITDGRYEKTKETPGGQLQVQSFHTQSEKVRAFFRRHFSGAAELVDLRSAEGILGGGLDKALAEASEDVVRAWADLLFERYSSDEAHLGCADHLVAVLRRGD